ncbi:hypothetical protein GCM10009795_023110 [Nocardioides hankookensis]|uniref:ClpX C4-type zinc finger protein n=1 Tax=Nocardioides hankookensis TaxID=443157 RepID=A0ABW1LGM4_9ACTN
MDLDPSLKFCSFCGDEGREDPPLFGGLGAFICGTCVADFARVLTGERESKAPPWERLTDVELLGHLWSIQQSAFQAEDFLVEWVDLARSRKLSWTSIGQALGIPRREAQERFSEGAR